MTCQTFRTQFAAGSADPAALAHLRSCQACLNVALERDDDVLFRALGGDDLLPPGGLDSFAADVMREVRLRTTENSFSRPSPSWGRKLALAAGLSAVIAGSAFMYQSHRSTPLPAGPVTHHRFEVASRPLVQDYDSKKATIVEVPGEDEAVRVVMVFDDSLPADL